ncbi:50S ribosomal protein L35 [Candidatus Parcubacteria bacterium]|nr:50S ribosomal protein L35 [Candidatus Parcubacteria bacterium]
MKSRKSILKRFKITRRGKFIRRPSGQDHFNAKESAPAKSRKRGKFAAAAADAKALRQHLNR